MKNVTINKVCNKCYKPIPFIGGWEKSSFLAGKIEIEMASGAERKYDSYHNHIDTPEISDESTGQKLVLKWGKEDGEYDLCHRCRDELVETLSNFFHTKKDR